MSRVKIDRDIEVYVGNNIFSSFSYSNDNGVSLELFEHGDEDVLTFGELKALASGRNKATLQKMYLIITDVVDDTVTIEDVLSQLKLDRYYNETKELLNVDEIDLDSFSDFCISSTNKELERAFEKSNLHAVLAETVIHLFTNKKVDDSKLKVALKSIGIDDVYGFIGDLEAGN